MCFKLCVCGITGRSKGRSSRHYCDRSRWRSRWWCIEASWCTMRHEVRDGAMATALRIAHRRQFYPTALSSIVSTLMSTRPCPTTPLLNNVYNDVCVLFSCYSYRVDLMMFFVIIALGRVVLRSVKASGVWSSIVTVSVLCDPTTTICRLVEINHRGLFKAEHYDANTLTRLHESVYDTAVARVYLSFDIDPTPIAIKTSSMIRAAYMMACSGSSRPVSLSDRNLRSLKPECRVLRAASPDALLVPISSRLPLHPTHSLTCILPHYSLIIH
jgi:hypothetical protein